MAHLFFGVGSFSNVNWISIHRTVRCSQTLIGIENANDLGLAELVGVRVRCVVCMPVYASYPTKWLIKVNSSGCFTAVDHFPFSDISKISNESKMVRMPKMKITYSYHDFTSFDSGMLQARLASLRVSVSVCTWFNYVAVNVSPYVRHVQHTKVLFEYGCMHESFHFFPFLLLLSMCSFINSNTDWYNNNDCQEFLWQKMFANMCKNSSQNEITHENGWKRLSNSMQELAYSNSPPHTFDICTHTHTRVRIE